MTDSSKSAVLGIQRPSAQENAPISLRSSLTARLRQIRDGLAAHVDRHGLNLGIVLGGAVLALSVIAVSGLSILNLHNAALVETEAGLRRLNLVLAEQTDRSMQSIDLVVTEIVKDLRDSEIDSPQAYRQRFSDRATHEMLRKKLSGLPQLDAITMINADGRLINFSRYWPIPEVNVTDRDYFAALRDHPEQRVFWSKPVQNRGTGTWTFYMAYRVSAADGGFIGLVLAAIELRYFEEFYRDVLPGEESAISLLRSDGVMLARYPVAAEAVGKSFWDAPAFAEILRHTDAGSTRVISPVDGQARILSARRLHNYPLAVNITQTKSAALAGWRSQAKLIGLMTTAAVLAIGLLTAVLGRRIRAYALLAEARAELNEAVVARARAEAMSQARAQFVASISHELRTPLNAILGFSEILKDEILGPLGSSQYRTYANDIHASGRHLLGIVNDILELTKAEASALTIDRESVDVAALVEQAAHMLRTEAKRSGLDLQLAVAADLPRITGDHRRLLQAVINLLSNAVKFTPSGGHVLLLAERRDDEVVITVRDDGIGMAAEDIPRAMEAFGQIDSGLAREYNGAGLGLPLAHPFVQLHGGSLVLESAPGQGTAAVITLPSEPTRLD